MVKIKSIWALELICWYNAPFYARLNLSDSKRPSWIPKEEYTSESTKISLPNFKKNQWAHNLVKFIKYNISFESPRLTLMRWMLWHSWWHGRQLLLTSRMVVPKVVLGALRENWVVLSWRGWPGFSPKRYMIWLASTLMYPHLIWEQTLRSCLLIFHFSFHFLLITSN